MAGKLKRFSRPRRSSMEKPVLSSAEADDAVAKEAAKPAVNRPIDNMRGAFWILLAAVLSSQMLMLVKLVGSQLPSTEVAFFRGAFGLAFIMPFVLRNGVDGFRTKRPGLQALRGLSSSLILICGFYAMVHLPLAQVSAISFSRPLFVLVLAALFLGERIRMFRTMATLAGFVGVLIIVRPGAGMEPAALIALLAAVFIAVNVTLVRILTRTDKVATMVFYPALVQTIVLAIPAAAVWQTPTWEQAGLLLGVGMVGTLMQACVVRAYSYAETSAMAPFDYTRLLFATLVGYLIFAEVPDIWTGVGSAILIGATFYIARREARLSRETAAQP